MQIKIVGSGGQGIVQEGIILGRAYAVYDNKYVVQTQSYGAEVRGTAVYTDIIVGDEKINELKVTVPDILIVHSQKGYSLTKKYTSLLIYDKYLVKPENTKNSKGIFCAKLSAQHNLPQNTIMLGYFAKLGYISKKSLIKSINDLFTNMLRIKNLNAIELGWNI